MSKCPAVSRGTIGRGCSRHRRLYANCTSRRRSVSSIARCIAGVTRSAYRIAVPAMWRDARPMVWINATSVRKKPSWSASRIATSETSGRSMPSRNSCTPTTQSSRPARRSARIASRSLGLQPPTRTPVRRPAALNTSPTLCAPLTDDAMTNDRSPNAAARRWHSRSASATWPPGPSPSSDADSPPPRTMTRGSQMSVGRTTSSAATSWYLGSTFFSPDKLVFWARRSRRPRSHLPGVAETRTASSTRAQNSSAVRGRLSSAEGSRKPCSTSVFLRARSPACMTPSCGIVRCDSSTTTRKRDDAFGASPSAAGK
mmetsp:Transcript_27254/g.109142  ORF Transcript_27254/g.109142 Transcript_27254/m.109142 type:complete len:314 (-) Transcript_27254:1119-2060(-)